MSTEFERETGEIFSEVAEEMRAMARVAAGPPAIAAESTMHDAAALVTVLEAVGEILDPRGLAALAALRRLVVAYGGNAWRSPLFSAEYERLAVAGRSRADVEIADFLAMAEGMAAQAAA